jgi:multicomponent Na+:H+ antiporter subunit D
MNASFLVLPIFLPLVGGLLSYLIPFSSEKRRRWFYGVLICLTTALVWLAILLCDGETFTLLRFTDTLDLTLRADGASRLFAGLSATLWPVTMVYAFDYMRHESRPALFWSFFTASFGVTQGVAFAGNLMTMYLFYELLTLATLPLVMHSMTKKAVQAGIKYVLYSMSGAALGFVGLVFCIVNNASDFVLGGHLAGYAGDPTALRLIFVLAFVGFGVKAAIWPLHAWLPAAAVAPTPVTALLHAVAVVKAGAFACIRLTYYAFGTAAVQGTWAQDAVMILAIMTILYGSCMSLKQRHFKRRLAYSTVSNLSYILFGAALMTTDGLVASFLHLIFHSLIKIMAFFAAGAVLHYAKREYVDEMEGLGKYMPLTFACFTVSACALTGVPPLNGFVSKWYLALAAVHTGQPLAVAGLVALLISALLTAIYMFQVVVKAWFPSRDAALIDPDTVREANSLMTVPMLLLAVACVLLGLFPQFLIDLIRGAVAL